MDNESQIIEEDQKKNPGCSYSSSFQKTCSTNNESGKFMCETIKNLQRLCPNKKPVTIYSQKSMTDSDELDNDISIPSIGMPFLGGFFNRNSPFDPNSDPFFKAESFFESILGLDEKSKEEFRNKPYFQQIKPNQNQYDKFPSSEKKPSGRISGSVEDI